MKLSEKRGSSTRMCWVGVSSVCMKAGCSNLDSTRTTSERDEKAE